MKINKINTGKNYLSVLFSLGCTSFFSCSSIKNEINMKDDSRRSDMYLGSSIGSSSAFYPPILPDNDGNLEISEIPRFSFNDYGSIEICGKDLGFLGLHPDKCDDHICLGLRLSKVIFGHEVNIKIDKDDSKNLAFDSTARLYRSAMKNELFCEFLFKEGKNFYLDRTALYEVCKWLKVDENTTKPNICAYIILIKNKITSIKNLLEHASKQLDVRFDLPYIERLKLQNEKKSSVIKDFISKNPESIAIKFYVKFGNLNGQVAEESKIMGILGEGCDGTIFLCRGKNGFEFVMKLFNINYCDSDKSVDLKKELTVREFLSQTDHRNNFIELLHPEVQCVQGKAALIIEKADMLLVELLKNPSKYIDSSKWDHQLCLLKGEMGMFDCINMKDFGNHQNVLVKKDEDGFYHIKATDFVMTEIRSATSNFLQIFSVH